MTTRVTVLNSTQHPDHPEAGTDGWCLLLQWARYVHGDGRLEHGYRFIWRRPDGSLQPARGQARIPSLQDAELLMRQAREEGWGDRRGE